MSQTEIGRSKSLSRHNSWIRILSHVMAMQKLRSGLKSYKQ